MGRVRVRQSATACPGRLSQFAVERRNRRWQLDGTAEALENVGSMLRIKEVVAEGSWMARSLRGG